MSRSLLALFAVLMVSCLGYGCANLGVYKPSNRAVYDVFSGDDDCVSNPNNTLVVQNSTGFQISVIFATGGREYSGRLGIGQSQTFIIPAPMAPFVVVANAAKDKTLYHSPSQRVAFNGCGVNGTVEAYEDIMDGYVRLRGL